MGDFRLNTDFTFPLLVEFRVFLVQAVKSFYFHFLCSASGIANLTGTDTPATAGIMDISGATAGIYSVPIFNVPQSAGMQAAQLTAPNPNATSPRPSILRKRTSEGYVENYITN